MYRFIEDGKALQIETAKTPTPWKNLLLNDEYFTEASQRLSGASFAVEDYKKSPVLEQEKYFYIKIGEKIYHLGAGKGQSFCCKHYLHKSVITEEFDIFTSEITVFVPTEGKREIWHVEIKNTVEQEITCEVFTCFEFANISYLSLECEYRNGYFCKTSFPYHIRYEEYEKLKPAERKVYAMSDKEVKSFECTRSRYFGGDNPYTIPAMVENGCGSNKKCEYETCAAGFHHQLVIGAGKLDAITYMAGETVTVSEIDEIRKNMPEYAKELQKAEQKWLKDTSALHIKTNHEDFDVFVNYWLQKQVIYLTRHNRGGVYCPVRNQLQDAMGYAVINPQEALEYALKVLRRQQFSGYLKQWYMTDGSPDTGLCLINHSDACVWLVICMVEIIKLNGDKSIYDCLESYSDTEEKESIYDHLKKAIIYMASQVGSHGLCLMKDGDWTDPINGAGRLGKGESTWNTIALIHAINLLGQVKQEKELEEIKKKLTFAVNEYCWDTDRYVAGFDDNGNWFGSRTEKEASLFLNAQTWALFAGICDKERKQIVRNTINTLKTDCGYLLLAPAFEDWNPIWGKISIKQRGNTENGSVYSHGNMFKAYADFACGDVDAGIETMLSILPTNEKNPPEKNKQVPLFIPNYYYGCEGDSFGQSSNVYSSGAAGWFLWVVVNHRLEIEDKLK